MVVWKKEYTEYNFHGVKIVNLVYTHKGERTRLTVNALEIYSFYLAQFLNARLFEVYTYLGIQQD